MGKVSAPEKELICFWEGPSRSPPRPAFPSQADSRMTQALIDSELGTPLLSRASFFSQNAVASLLEASDKDFKAELGKARHRPPAPPFSIFSAHPSLFIDPPSSP